MKRVVKDTKQKMCNMDYRRFLFNQSIDHNLFIYINIKSVIVDN